MTLFRSVTVEFEWAGHIIEIRRPKASTQSGWISRIASQSGGALTAEEIGRMEADIASLILKVDGEEIELSQERIDETISPLDVAELWGVILGACRVNREEKKSSVTLPPSPVIPADGTTAAGVVTAGELDTAAALS